MIRSFRSKALAAYWNDDVTAKLAPQMIDRIAKRLDALDAAERLEDLRLPGFGLHPLLGFSPTRYAISVNGPWRITFSFEDGDAHDLDFEQYH